MEVKILGITYKVERGIIPGEDYGIIDYEKQTITVDRNLSDEEFVETVLHETIHGVCRAMMISFDEPAVFRLSRGLFSVLSDPENVELHAAIGIDGWELGDPVLDAWEDEEEDDYPVSPHERMETCTYRYSTTNSGDLVIMPESHCAPNKV